MPFILWTRNFGWNLVRSFLMWLDTVVYSLISFLFNVIFDIANVPISAFQGLYDDITSKIYLILAIFMLFKVIVSLLTYLVNPDAISDKQQGAGKLVTRIITVFVLLIATPTLFSTLYRAQGPIIRTLPRLILGVEQYGNDQSTEISNGGTSIAWNVLNAFYYKNPSCYGSDTTSPYFANPITENVIKLAGDHINDACDQNGGDSSVYAYEYSAFISTIAGGFLCYTLIGIAISIAIRMFKLIILQLLAPIPIISYIDPKSGKDGTFNKWIKAVMSVWLELFINLAVVYIILNLVANIISRTQLQEFGTYFENIGSGSRQAFFLVFIIIGLFAFARQAPKFIMDILGLKDTGSFGKALGMSAALLGAPIAAGVNFSNRAKTEGLGSAFLNTGRSLFTGVGSAFVGAQAAYASDKGGMKAANDARKKYLEDSLNYVSSSTKKKQEMYDRAKAVNDSAFNVKKVLEEEAVKDDEYKTIASHVNAAMNGDEVAKQWLANNNRTKDFATKVRTTMEDPTGDLADDGYYYKTEFDVAGASKWLENDFKDEKVNDLFASYGTGKNSRVEDAIDEHNKSIDEAKNIRVGGEKVEFAHVDRNTKIGGSTGFKATNLGRSSHAVSKLSQDTGIRGAGRRSKKK